MTKGALEAARALGRTILEHRERTEGDRRIAEPIVERLIEEGFCRMFLSEDLGGHPASPLEVLEIYEVLAGFEASVPWIAWNNALVCLLSRYLHDEARRALFSDPTWLYAQSTQPSGTASVQARGYRVSGRWSLVSGCEHAEWLLLNCVVETDGKPRTTAAGPEARYLFLRRGDCEIVDTWHVGGLRGTGSHDVVVEDVFVPVEHSLAVGGELRPDATPIERVPIFVHMNACFAAQALGVARRCVDTLVERGRTRRRPGPAPDLCERPAAQLAVATHDTALAAARGRLHDCVGALWKATNAERAVSNEALGDAYAAAFHASGAARDAVDAMYALGGTRSLYTTDPVERAHRDVHAMLRHIVAQPLFAEDAGRVKFGLEPSFPLYAI